MLKRTRGRLLLTLLVTTGLAGTLSDTSLSQKERRQAINLIRNSRNEVLKNVEGLSLRQIKYKPTPDEFSIGEILMIMTSEEKNCNEQIKAVMSQPANSEDRLKIALTDAQLLANDNYTICKMQVCTNNNTLPKNPADAIKKFMALRDDQIKYIRTSTEDLRNHVIKSSSGWIDCYQYHLLLADRSHYFAEMVNKIRSAPGFPKK